MTVVITGTRQAPPAGRCRHPSSAGGRVQLLARTSKELEARVLVVKDGSGRCGGSGHVLGREESNLRDRFVGRTPGPCPMLDALSKTRALSVC